MPLDLKTSKAFGRGGVLVENDHLLVLEYRGTSDRLWRVPFERVGRVVVVRRVPVGLVLVSLLFTWFLGVIFLSQQEPAFTVGGFIFMGVGVAIAALFALQGKTTIHLTTEERVRSFTTMAGRQKVARFVAKLCSRIEQVQEAKWRELEGEGEAEQGVESGGVG